MPNEICRANLGGAASYTAVPRADVNAPRYVGRRLIQNASRQFSFRMSPQGFFSACGCLPYDGPRLGQVNPNGTILMSRPTAHTDSRFVFTRCRWATSGTEAPFPRVSSTIARFSASVYLRRTGSPSQLVRHHHFGQRAHLTPPVGTGHVELLGKVRDRGVRTPELLQNAASGGVRERGERGIEAGRAILNHMVQYLTHGLPACKGRPSALRCRRAPTQGCRRCTLSPACFRCRASFFELGAPTRWCGSSVARQSHSPRRLHTDSRQALAHVFLIMRHARGLLRIERQNSPITHRPVLHPSTHNHPALHVPSNTR